MQLLGCLAALRRSQAGRAFGQLALVPRGVYRFLHGIGQQHMHVQIGGRSTDCSYRWGYRMESPSSGFGMFGGPLSVNWLLWVLCYSPSDIFIKGRHHRRRGRDAITHVNRIRLYLFIVTGEQTQLRGAEGSHAAKRWLESTTRAQVPWENPDAVAAKKLTFSWEKEVPPKDKDFSFDLGGVFSGEDDFHHTKEGELFVAEVKNYQNASDQGSHFEKFLAKCFCARRHEPKSADVFMWITWSPFKANTWSMLHSKSSIVEAIIKLREQALGIADEEDARSEICSKDIQDLIEYLSENIWIIVLCEQQEQFLTLSTEDRKLLIARKI
jgi:hypothetical protein